MRLGIIADIHGNAVALDAVLARLGRDGVDHIICLGDVALRGPEPRRALAVVRALGCPVVLGNTDAWFLDWQAEGAVAPVPWMAQRDEWCARQLSAADLAYIGTFRPAIEISLGGDTQLLCFHGSPRSHSENIVATTAADDVEGMLSGSTAAVLAGGHTHVPMLRYHGARVIINPGSVGLPFDRVSLDDPIRLVPWVQYAVVDAQDDALSVELRRLPMDIAAVIRAAVDSGMPAADRWAELWRTASRVHRGEA